MKKREVNYNKAVIKAEKEMENEFEKPRKPKNILKDIII